MAKILTIDDSVTMCKMIEKILQSHGHEVVIADSPRKALDIARDQTFDLILCDVNMPEMSGISLVSKLRRLAGYNFTPIIMVTTEGSDYKKEKARSTGATGWLQKPVTEDRLIKAVQKLTG
ncbi:MAG: response regulator [Gammaproteobacteria bacterium]|nr:response regulator [Gammaproteobacteria bacterium]